jgi:hypothetical protein
MTSVGNLVRLQAAIAIWFVLRLLYGIGDHLFPPGKDASNAYHAICTVCYNEKWPLIWRQHDPPRCRGHKPPLPMELCQQCLQMRDGG